MPQTIELAGQKFHREGDELYPDYLNHGNAASFIRHVAERWCKGKGIDVGCGKWPLPGAKAIDNGADNALALPSIPDGSLDYVHSSHCLEHLTQADAQRALKLWVRKLKTSGLVFLYLPHPAMKLWAPGGAWVGNGHKWQPDQQLVCAMLWEAGAVEVARSDWPDAYWSFYSVGRKR